MSRERKKDAAFRHKEKTAMTKIEPRQIAPPQSQAIVIEKPSEALSHGSQQAIQARTAERMSRLLNKQVFIELHSGSRYSGILLGISDGMVELDIGFFAAKSIAVMSEVLLPRLKGW